MVCLEHIMPHQVWEDDTEAAPRWISRVSLLEQLQGTYVTIVKRSKNRWCLLPFPPKFQTHTHTQKLREALRFTVMILKKMSSRGKGAAEPRWAGSGKSAWMPKHQKGSPRRRGLGKPPPPPAPPCPPRPVSRVCQDSTTPTGWSHPGARGGCQPKNIWPVRAVIVLEL